MKTSPLFLTFVLSLSLVACGKEEPAQSAAPADAPADMSVEGIMGAGADAAVGLDAHALYAANCLACHGAVGEGIGENPKLAGLTRAGVASRLKDYRDGKQMGPKTAIMAATAKPLTDGQIIALARYVGE